MMAIMDEIDLFIRDADLFIVYDGFLEIERIAQYDDKNGERKVWNMISKDEM